MVSILGSGQGREVSVPSTDHIACCVGILTRGWVERECPSFVILWLMHKRSEQSGEGFHVSVWFILSSHTGLCPPLLSPIKQRSAVCSGFLFPSTLSPHPVTQPASSAPWPEVTAPSVDPFPLNDTPPPLPAKKHRPQQQLEQQVMREVDRAWGFDLENKVTHVLFFIFSKVDFFERQVAERFSFLPSS